MSAAPAGAELRFVPVDAAIWKKRTEQGTGKSETTRLPKNKRSFYNGGDGNDKILSASARRRGRSSTPASTCSTAASRSTYWWPAVPTP